MTAERDAYERAKPVFAAHCVSCHSYGGTSRRAFSAADFTGFPFGGATSKRIGVLVRTAVGASGKPPTMPQDKPGSLTPDELARVLAWTDAWSRAHPEAVAP